MSECERESGGDGATNVSPTDDPSRLEPPFSSAFVARRAHDLVERSPVTNVSRSSTGHFRHRETGQWSRLVTFVTTSTALLYHFVTGLTLVTFLFAPHRHVNATAVPPTVIPLSGSLKDPETRLVANTLNPRKQLQSDNTLCSGL